MLVARPFEALNMQVCSDLALATCGDSTLRQKGYGSTCSTRSFLAYKARFARWRSLTPGRYGGWQLVHLDLKSPNVLLQDKHWLVAKIADLGVSKYLVEGSLLEFTMRGAPTNPAHQM